MPIYEYRCSNCHRKVSIFWRSISAVDESKARCSYCGSTQLSKLASRVRVIRGGSGGGASSDESAPDTGGMDERMLSEMGGLDENDPRSLGHFMRKMADQTGEEMGPEFNEIVGRLEKGEDPEKIEQSMGDLFGDAGGPDGGMGGMGMDDDYPMAPPTPEPTDEAGAEKEPADKGNAKPARRPVRAKKVAKPSSKSSKKAKK
jgi:putative FmdB family regulatory protein